MGRRSYAGAARPLALANPIDNVATTFVSSSTPLGWPDGSAGPFSVTFNRGGVNEEKILCSTRSGNTFTVLARGYDSTTATSHSSPEAIEHTTTGVDADEANFHVNASTGVHGLAALDHVAGVIAAQTFLNKNIDGGNNNLTNIPRLASPQIDAALTALAATDTADAAAMALLLALAGGTMTGPLILSADPVVALGAATKQYADAVVAVEAAARAGAITTEQAAAVRKAGDTMTGLLLLSADPAAALGAATKQYVDAAVAGSLDAGTWTAFTPGLHGSGGGAPTIGNATNYSKYRLETHASGKTLYMLIEWVNGSTTNFGLGSLLVDLPGGLSVPAANPAHIGSGLALGAGPVRFPLAVELNNTTQMIFVDQNGAVVSGATASPFSWVAGSTLRAQCVLAVA